MRDQDGFGVLVSVEVTRSDGRPLTIGDVRGVDFGRLVLQANANRRTTGARARANGTTPTELERVAEIYRAALADGDPPTRAVQDAFNVSKRTASRLVSRARDAGHLGAAVRRRAGERKVIQPVSLVRERKLGGA